MKVYLSANNHTQNSNQGNVHQQHKPEVLLVVTSNPLLLADRS